MVANGFCFIETGANTRPANVNAINNIFDLAGNTAEWTTEKRKDSGNYRLSGGCCESYSYAHPIIDTSLELSGTIGTGTASSRPILYK